MLMKSVAALALGLALAPNAASAQAAGDTGARILFEARLRSETLDQQGFARQAHALTLRSRLGWRTPTVHGLQGLVEVEGVSVLDDRYSAPLDPVTGRPAVADGEVVELNRAQVRWSGTGVEATAGRQRLVLGNGRFLGNSGWRQNEQTFDGLQVTTPAARPVRLTYAWASRVRRPLGPDHPNGVWRGDIHMVQAETSTPAGKLSGFGLFVDLDNAAAQSSTTWGARLAGSRAVHGDLSLAWTGEYAVQSDAGANPADFRLDYQAASLGLQTPRRSIGLGYERLDGNGLSAFQTPLGSGHAFLGWSDVITTTPAFGVRHVFLKGSVALGAFGRPVRVAAEVHDFHDAGGSVRLGRELDLSASAPINARWSVELKAAHFDGDHPAFGDADKGWLILEYRY